MMMVIHDTKNPELLERRKALVNGGFWTVYPDGKVEAKGKPDHERGFYTVKLDFNPDVPDGYVETYRFLDDDNLTYYKAEYYYHK